MRIVIQVATHMEWSSLMSLLGNPAEERALDGRFVTVRRGAAEIIAVHGGVGKVHAAAMAQYAILTWKPDLVVVMGTSGAVAPDLKVLDIVVANRTIIWDVDSGLDGSSDEMIREWSTDLGVPALPKRLPFPIRVGAILTGDCSVTRQNVERLRGRFDGLVADWESGAVARVCALNRVPCMVLRGVSDAPSADGEAQLGDYIKNTPAVMGRLWQALTEISKEVRHS